MQICIWMDSSIGCVCRGVLVWCEGGRGVLTCCDCRWVYHLGRPRQRHSSKVERLNSSMCRMLQVHRWAQKASPWNQKTHIGLYMLSWACLFSWFLLGGSHSSNPAWRRSVQYLSGRISCPHLGPDICCGLWACLELYNPHIAWGFYPSSFERVLALQMVTLTVASVLPPIGLVAVRAVPSNGGVTSCRARVLEGWHLGPALWHGLPPFLVAALGVTSQVACQQTSSIIVELLWALVGLATAWVVNKNVSSPLFSPF